MTTLRRERRAKFEEILSRFDDKLTRAEIEEAAELLADAAERKSDKKTDEPQGIYSTAYRRGEQEPPDKLDSILAMANFPGAKKAARVDALLSAFGVAFIVNTETKEWRKLAEYAVKMQDQGWQPEQFIRWVKSQDGYPTYWTCRRMLENYPKAFEHTTDETKTSLLRTL